MIAAKVYKLNGPFDLSLEEEVINDEVAPNEIIAKTVYSAVSPGTELAAFIGAPPLRPMKVYPRMLGYCNMARVIQVGASVKAFQEGDYILSFQSHRTHFRCTETEVIFNCSESDPLKRLTLTYLYHLGYAALLSGDAKPGTNVAIIGAGTLGFSTASLSKSCSLQTAIFTGREEVVSFLNNKGIDAFLKSEPKSALQRLSTNGYDIIINTSNSWNDWEFALKIARKGGVIVNLGFPGREQPIPQFNPLDSKYLYDKQLTIKSTGHIPDIEIDASQIRFTIKRNMQFLADLIKTGTLDAEALISSEISASDLSSEYQKMKERRGIYFTSLLNWE